VRLPLERFRTEEDFALTKLWHEPSRRSDGSNFHWVKRASSLRWLEPQAGIALLRSVLA
jgi:hypothetical protein